MEVTRVRFPLMEVPLSVRVLDTIANICDLVVDGLPCLQSVLTARRKNMSCSAFFIGCFRNDGNYM